MSVIELVMIAVGLAMDAFAVSVTNGMLKKKFDLKYSVIMAGMFGLFQLAMPIIGYYAGVLFKDLIQSVDHWIAFVLLAFIGSKMIYEAICGKDEEESTPVGGKMLVVMAIATSIDALAVGASFTCMGLNTFDSIVSPIATIGIMSTLMSVVGATLGILLGKKFRFPAELIGGIILIGIGIKILI